MFVQFTMFFGHNRWMTFLPDILRRSRLACSISIWCVFAHVRLIFGSDFHPYWWEQVKKMSSGERQAYKFSFSFAYSLSCMPCFYLHLSSALQLQGTIDGYFVPFQLFLLPPTFFRHPKTTHLIRRLHSIHSMHIVYIEICIQPLLSHTHAMCGSLIPNVHGCRTTKKQRWMRNRQEFKRKTVSLCGAGRGGCLIRREQK